MTADGFTLSTSPTRPRSTSPPSIVHAGAPAGAEQPGVLAGEADGQRAVLVEQADELAADLAGEDHPDDLHDLGRRDPQPVAELAGQPEPAEHRAICGPPPCTTTGRSPAYRRKAMSWAKARLRVVVDHRVAAVLDDDERAAEPLEPRQRLDEGLRLARGDARAAASMMPRTVLEGTLRRSWSCAVRRVLVDVVVGQVVGPDRRGLVAGVQVDEDVDLAAGEVDEVRGRRRRRRPGRPGRR